MTRRQSDQRNEAAIAAGERRYAASLDPDYRDRLRSQLETDELASRPPELNPDRPAGMAGSLFVDLPSDRCADCGLRGELTGHMGCQFPGYSDAQP